MTNMKLASPQPALPPEAEPGLLLASIPRAERNPFGAEPDAHFYMGVLAVPGMVEDPSGWLAARRLRANVYIDEKGYLPPEAREADGGETDIDDQRSIQFGVFENMPDSSQTRMVGTSRLIVKSENNAVLPIETLFPETFANNPAEPGAVEASRYISRHEDKLAQRFISLGLIRAMDAWAVKETKQPIYAVVEEYLAGMFSKINLPYVQIADEKWVDSYNSVNMAIKIDPESVIKSVDAEKHTTDIMRGFFRDVYEHYGLGFFDRSFTVPMGK
jgi:N-acyl-L-homoserine lactone synthetase